MNEFQLKLWNELSALVGSNEAFYFQDFNLDRKTYRIFNYRLASYSDFLLPSALECRGIMFEVGSEQLLTTIFNAHPIRLASLPMEKFFNLNENPITMNMDLSQIKRIELKADGSLMSTYVHNNILRLKSKGSLFSEQALAAMLWLQKKPFFTADIADLAHRGYTVNLEWCSPEHRIVLGYMEPHLKVLNVRNNENGHYLSHEQVKNHFIDSDLVIEAIETEDFVQYVKDLPSQQNIEGVVIVFNNGQKVKAKTEWYLSLHHAKDSVNNPRRLFEAILDEGIDDLRSMFASDPLAIKIIDEMQIKVDHIYNAMVKMVEDYHEQNKHLDRKTYAIQGQEHFKGTLYFGLAMNKYTGKEMNYKEFLKGKWKELGLKDTSVEKDDGN